MRPLPAAIFTLSLLALACAAPTPEVAAPLVLTDMKLGSLKQVGGELQLDQELTRVPLVPGSSGDIAHSFGICFKATGGQRPGELSIMVYPPAEISVTHLDRVEGGVRVVAALPEGTEQTCQDMYFDASDPAGVWRFVLTDGTQTFHTWEVEVYKP